MRCLSCKYPLSNLSERRCPECGREFDPQNERTFHHDHWLSKKAAMTILVCMFIASLIIAVLMRDSTNYLLLMATPVVVVILVLSGWTVRDGFRGGSDFDHLTAPPR